MSAENRAITDVTTSVDAAALDLYLDRVVQLYPRGVAERFLRAPEPSLAPNPARDTTLSSQPRSTSEPPHYAVVFIIVTVGESLVPKEDELLGAIIEKGLKLTREQTSVMVCPHPRGEHIGHGEGVQSAVTRAIADFSPKLIIVMGNDEGQTESAQGRVTTVAGVPQQTALLRTHSLNAVAASPEVKREFWGHLQGGIRVL